MAEVLNIDDNVSNMQSVLEDLELNENDLVSMGEMRSAYAESVTDPPIDDKNRADEIINADLHKPLAKAYNLNGESVPSHTEIALIASDIGIDAISIDHEIINTANKYTTLMSGMLKRLRAARERIARNRQRIEDINFVNTAYAGMKDVQPLTADDFSGKLTNSNGTFAAEAVSMDQVKFTVDDISGNGYVGNAYVLDSTGKYTQETNDTGIISYITDNSPATVFEYSRLVNDDNGAYIASVQNRKRQNIINFDDKDAECVITIHSSSKNAFNTIVFSEPGAGLKVTQVEISTDGVTYKNTMGSAVELNGNIYDAKNYAPGCNLVSFPSTSYARIHLASSRVANDYALGRDAITADGVPQRVIERLNNARRKVVSFGGIIAYAATYTPSAILTDNLAPSGGCKRIAFFANEYIPSVFDGVVNPIKYEMIVNGETYVVKPINSDAQGVKIISSSNSTYSNAGTLFINDTIRTAQLKITFNARNEDSPYVGNIKACVG